jgi:hypothetical protein
MFFQDPRRRVPARENRRTLNGYAEGVSIVPRRFHRKFGAAFAVLLATFSAGFARVATDEANLGALGAVLSMPDTASGGPGTAVQVPISAVPGDGVLGIDMTLQYDPSVILATRVTTSGIAAAQGFGLAANLNTPGTIIISMYATQNPLSGSGEIVRVYFDVVGSPGATSALTFVRAYINEGGIPATLDNGLFTVTCAGAPDGTPCNDGNACTLNETCQGGTCTAGSVVTCSAVDPCHDVGLCDPATGVCTNPPKPDGAVCDDGNPCTASDQCAAGVCGGVPTQGPGEVTNLRMQSDKATLVWDLVAGAGAGTVYDAARGNLAGLPVGPGGGDESCVANGVAAATASDTTLPPPGGGFWYLARAQDPCGSGTYGFEERRGLPPAERVTATCP